MAPSINETSKDKFSAKLENENLLQLVLNTIPSYVFWKDRNSNYLGCNQNFSKSAGLNSPEEIVGLNDYDLAWSKEDSDFYRKVDRIVMESEEPQLNFEESQTVADGTTYWLSTTKIPLYDSEGNVIGILGTYEDITAKKLMELELIERNERLQKLNTELERVNTDLEQFAYAASHDLQEPLRMIGSFVGLLEKQYGETLDQNGKEYMRYIKDGTLRMSSLIKQILSYSKIKKSEQPYTFKNFNAILATIQKDLSKLISDKNAEITYKLPQTKIACQPERISMLFSNLISNGIKFNESKSPKIKISFQEKEFVWLFTIEDNGIGIEEEYHDYIFKPFKRLNNRNNYSGSGIGLSICKRIINLHGGEIWFESQKDKGTTFHFTLSKRNDIMSQNEEEFRFS